MAQQSRVLIAVAALAAALRLADAIDFHRTNRRMVVDSFRDEAGQIRTDEGVRTKAYRDSLGFLTIGVGHLVTPADGITVEGQEITAEQVQTLFDHDLDAHALVAYAFVNTADDVSTLSTNTDPTAFLALPVEAQRVLFNMAFNMGGKLAQFKKLRRAVKSGDWAGASAAMRTSKWCEQVGARCTRLATRMAAVTTASTGTTVATDAPPPHVDPDEPGPLMDDTPLTYSWLPTLPYYARLELETVESMEGKVATVYRDPTRKKSESVVLKVGVGHVVVPGDGLKEGDTVTPDRIASFLRLDCEASVRRVREYVSNFDSLDGEVQRVLFNMAFTLQDSLFTFTSLQAAVQSGDVDRVTAEITKSKWCRDRVPKRCAILVSRLSSLTSTLASNKLATGAATLPTSVSTTERIGSAYDKAKVAVGKAVDAIMRGASSIWGRITSGSGSTSSPSPSPSPTHASTSGGTSSSSGGGGSSTSPQEVRVPVPWFSQFAPGHGYTPGDTACFKAAKAMVETVKGVTVQGSDKRIQVAIEEDSTGGVTVDAAKAKAAIDYIRAEINSGRAVEVGVSHFNPTSVGKKAYNVDGITDHFVAITGYGVDASGRVYFTFHDPGTTEAKRGSDTNANNRFLLDPVTGKLARAGLKGRGYVTQRQMEVAMVRLNAVA